MDLEFWHEKWDKNEIGFHLKKSHPLLKKYLTPDRLESVKSVFVPLCGKTLDIQYLLDLGLSVVANELSDVAVQALFKGLEIEPEVHDWAGGKCYSAGNLKVWAGDFFELTPAQLGLVDLIYDRAALIALPQDMRIRYAKQLMQISNNAPQFLITLAYDQNVMSGPPFSVSREEVAQHYSDVYKLETLSNKDIIEYESKFASRGIDSLVESAYWLSC